MAKCSQKLLYCLLKYDQQDAMLRSFFISVNCSTCFGWIPHPSSGAQHCYLQHMVFVKPLLLPAAIVEEFHLEFHKTHFE